jgi:inositol phosphorylceramide mannosyltransferase catalytic subunit
MVTLHEDVLGTIPKRLIHIYSAPPGQSPELSLFSRAAQCNVRLLHPDFDYVLFDRERIDLFLRTEFPQYCDVFSAFRFPIQRFDFFRYLAIYRLGGFYFDLDVFLARNLTPLLGASCVFPFEELTISKYLRTAYSIDWELGNYAFGAAPGHPFIKAVIDNCVKAVEDPDWASTLIADIPGPFRRQFYVTNTTGPGVVTRTLAEREDLRSSVSVLFPQDVRDERHWHRFGDYGVHLMQASWRSRDGFIRRRLTRFWENRRRNILRRQSANLGPVRNGSWKTLLSPGSS